MRIGPLVVGRAEFRRFRRGGDAGLGLWSWGAVVSGRSLATGARSGKDANVKVRERTLVECQRL